MKKIVVSFSLLLLVGVTAVSATPVTAPDPRVEKQFKKEFAGAENVKWGEEEGYISASFVLAGQRTHAWFSKEGELVGAIRGISYNQLPLVVIRALYARFADPVFIEMREVTNTDGTRYKLILENGHKKFRVTILPDGSFEQTVRVKK